MLEGPLLASHSVCHLAEGEAPPAEAVVADRREGEEVARPPSVQKGAKPWDQSRLPSSEE